MVGGEDLGSRLQTTRGSNRLDWNVGKVSPLQKLIKLVRANYVQIFAERFGDEERGDVCVLSTLRSTNIDCIFIEKEL